MLRRTALIFILIFFGSAWTNSLNVGESTKVKVAADSAGAEVPPMLTIDPCRKMSFTAHGARLTAFYR